MINSINYAYTDYNACGAPCLTPQQGRNYTVFDDKKADYFVKQGKKALPALTDVLMRSNDEAQITETLYILNKMHDAGIKGIDKMYPQLSRFNDTLSPYIQTFLAGIYRKIQAPDAFGPLVRMLLQNSMRPKPNVNFNPDEEIGGAVLSYISDRFNKQA